MQLLHTDGGAWAPRRSTDRVPPQLVDEGETGADALAFGAEHLLPPYSHPRQ
jgi:hypothetical protein